MYRHLLSAIISLLPFIVHAQQKGLNIRGKKLAVADFRQLDGGVPLIWCQLEGFDDTLSFVLDSGSSGVSLDSTFCAQYGLVAAPTEKTVSGISGSSNVKLITNKRLDLFGLMTSPMNFHQYDYSALSSVYGERIDGVLGYPFFGQYILYLDYDALKISFYANGPVVYPKSGLLLKPKINPLPLQTLTIKDRKAGKMPFFMDSGAGLAMLFSEQYAKDSGLLDSRRKIFYTRAEGLGGSKKMRLTVLNEMRLGKYRFREVPLYVFDDDQNVTRYPYSGGLIGNDILKRFNTLFNYASHEIYLTPNTHFEETFDYGYSGVTLHLIQDKIVVEDVVPSSPADRAGFNRGDEIISINNLFSGNLRQYKAMLQTPDQWLKVIVRREEQLKVLTMIPQNILN